MRVADGASTVAGWDMWNCDPSTMTTWMPCSR